MVALAREYAPDAKVVVGGYGVAIDEPEQYFGTEHICRGDGVAYMRTLLDEPARPFVDPQTESRPARMLGFKLPSSVYVVGSLGCDKGCDFCITSHFFGCKTTGVVSSGQQLLDLILRHRAKERNRLERDGVQNVFIFSEDFLANKQIVTEFHDLYRDLRDGLPVSIGCFGSAAAVAQYTGEYLAEAGITSIWIGVESRLFKHRKLRDVDLPALFADLHDNGIVTTASLILGLPAHTPANIQDDIDFLLRLEPTFCQFSLYTPLPGTPAYATALKKGWLKPDFDSRMATGFNQYFDHPSFASGELEGLLASCLDREMRELGPSAIRCLGALALRHARARAAGNAPRARRIVVYSGRTLLLAPLIWPLAVLYRPALKKTAALLRLLHLLLRVRGPLIVAALLLSPFVSLVVLMNFFFAMFLERLGRSPLRFSYTMDYGAGRRREEPVEPMAPSPASLVQLRRRPRHSEPCAETDVAAAAP
jgi:hypothetical protein